MNKPNKVLMAYDGLAGADAALSDLKRAGLPVKTEALVVSIADVFLPPEGFVEESVPEAMALPVRRGWEDASQRVKDSEKLAKRAADQIKADFPDWQVRAEAFADSPAWGILKKAQEWKADLDDDGGLLF